MLYSHFTQNCIFCTFWRLKILVLWRKIVQNLLIFVYLFCPKNSTTDFTKIFITEEWLVVESCPTPRWIAFLMLYRLVYNIRSHFNELILTWSAYYINQVCGDKSELSLMLKNRPVTAWFGKKSLLDLICQLWDNRN